VQFLVNRFAAPATSAREHEVLRRALKTAGNGAAMLLMALPAACSGIEARVASRREDVFVFWGQLVALVPGILGRFLRRAYYRMTLEQCALDCDIGFLAWFSHRSARVGRNVYIGPQAIVGTASLGDGAMIGSRASILSGAHQHVHNDQGELQPFSLERAERVEVGSHAWIGEGALIMASVGAHSIVAAGAVVSVPVPDRVVVAGNPCRFVRSLRPEGSRAAAQ
jgi:acetyltransferase-like isoleucine patch superfamily enzyme